MFCWDVNVLSSCLFSNIFTNCSYRGSGRQCLGALELRALIDSELVMLCILCTGMHRGEVQRLQSARRCWRTLTRWGVRGRLGVDLREGGVAAARAGLLGGTSLKRREKGGGGGLG